MQVEGMSDTVISWCQKYITLQSLALLNRKLNIIHWQNY